MNEERGNLRKAECDTWVIRSRPSDTQLFRNMLKDTFIFFTLGPYSRACCGCLVLAEQDRLQPWARKRFAVTAGPGQPSIPACRPPRWGYVSPFSPRSSLQEHADPPGRPRACASCGARVLTGHTELYVERQSVVRAWSAKEPAGAAAGKGARKDAGRRRSCWGASERAEAPLTSTLVPSRLLGRISPRPPARFRRPAVGTPPQDRRGEAAGMRAARRPRRGPAGGAAGGGRAFSGAALYSRRGLRRERSREAAVGGEGRGHGTARREGTGTARPWRSAPRSAERSGWERRSRVAPSASAAGAWPRLLGAGPADGWGAGLSPASPQTRGWRGRSGPCTAEPPSPGGRKRRGEPLAGPGLPGAPRGVRPSASGLPGEGYEQESHCFGKRSRGPTVPRRAGAISPPELEFSPCSGPPGTQARNRGLPGRGSSRSRAFWCKPPLPSGLVCGSYSVITVWKSWQVGFFFFLLSQELLFIKPSGVRFLCTSWARMVSA